MITNADIEVMLEKLTQWQHMLSPMEKQWLIAFASRYEQSKKMAAQTAANAATAEANNPL